MDHDGQGTSSMLDRAPVVLLGAALAASGALLFALQTRIEFFVDEWDFLLDRGGLSLDVLLRPHNEHISVIPIAIYKTLEVVFGIDSARPYQLVLIAFLSATAVLLFMWLRRRVGAWAALAGTVVVLFLGSAGTDLLWAFQITLVGSTAFGLGALLALDRQTRVADRLTCLLLVVAIGFNTLGVVFAAGVGVDVLTRPDRRRRAYVFAVPLILYALWWLGWGRTADSGASLHHLATSPSYILDGLSTSAASLFGLVAGTAGSASDPLAWGRPLLVLGLALAGWRIWKVGRFTRSLAVVTVMALVFWFLAALNGERAPTTDRYHYMGVIFILMIAAELARGIRFRRSDLLLLWVVTALAVVGNLASFGEGGDFFLDLENLWNGDLAALEIARDRADPAATVIPSLTAGPYLRAIDAYGSPAPTAAELSQADEPVRVQADKQLVSLLGIGEVATATPRGGNCEAVSLDPGVPATMSVAGEVTVEAPATSDVDLALRRFSSSASPGVDLGPVAAGQAARFEIPPDRSEVPWYLLLSGSGSAAVCRTPGAGGSAGASG